MNRIQHPHTESRRSAVAVKTGLPHGNRAIYYLLFLTFLILLSIVFLGIQATPAAAAPGENNGTFAYEFATLDTEPVGRSLAGAHLASVTGPEAMAWNPAGLGRLESSGAVLSHANWIADTQLEWGAVALQLPGNKGGLGFSVGMLRSGELAGYTAEGSPTGSFSPVQAMAQVAYGRLLSRSLALGVAIEGVMEGDGQDETNQAWAYSAGLQWGVGSFQIGLAAQHFGPQAKLTGGEYPLPATVRGGISYLSNMGLNLSGAVEQVVSGDSKFLFGCEWRPVGSVATLAGLNYGSHNSDEQELQMTYGLALDVAGSRIAYSYQPGELLDASHQISLSLPLSTTGR
jgi:hypothetical protein